MRKPLQILTISAILATRALGADLPVCGGSSGQDWQFVVDHQLGLRVSDPVVPALGPYAGRTKQSGLPGAWGGRNWFPIDGYKRTVCGTLKKFSMFNGPGDEKDFHPFVEPDDVFSFALDDPLSLKSGQIYGEITLPSKFEKEWLGTSVDPVLFHSQDVNAGASGALYNGAFCMYGPWVSEEFHQGVPEIHPASQWWFRTSQGLDWVVLQDASDRFGNRGGRQNFCPVEGYAKDCQLRMPPAFRQWWTLSSVKAWSQMEFEAPIEGTRKKVTIEDVSGSLGPRRDKIFGTYSKIEVDYPKPDDGFFVELVEQCTVDGKVRGVIKVSADVQAPAPKREEGQGYLHLRYHDSDAEFLAPPVPVPLPPPSVADIAATLLSTITDEVRGKAKRIDGWTRYAYGTRATYLADDGTSGESEAERLNLILAGADPTGERGFLLTTGVKGRSELEGYYADEFGGFPPDLPGFKVALSGSVGPDPLPILDDCTSPPRSGQMAACVVDSSLPIYRSAVREVAQIGLWVKDDFRGGVTLRAQIKDPKGREATAVRGLKFPLDANTPQTAMEGLVLNILRETGMARLEWDRIWDFSPGNLAVRPACDEKLRVARSLHMAALAAARDADVTSEERDRINALTLALVQAMAKPPCPTS